MEVTETLSRMWVPYVEGSCLSHLQVWVVTMPWLYQAIKTPFFFQVRDMKRPVLSLLWTVGSNMLVTTSGQPMKMPSGGIDGELGMSVPT
ncbi:Uncharacterized protein TCM_006520 [Theobroma cacao]|uniref:Uncharacterized protein n=1 Tax=Theobroma cacao TaxID=3641 RepID=A0A061DXU1_THECC|nr:Uncharacterized protein TCM_006520 [Theobroma cacao]